MTPPPTRPTETPSTETRSTPTPSLRRRVSIAVVGLFAALLTVVGIGIDLAVGAQLNRDLDARLADRTFRAANLVLAGIVGPQLVAQLQGQDIRVQVVSPDGSVQGDLTIVPGPPPPPPPRGGPPRRRHREVVPHRRHPADRPRRHPADRRAPGDRRAHRRRPRRAS